jgi:uncharacterized protein (UPF0276 family)
VNNVFVASTNQQADPFAYIDAFPLASVREIHLAGYTEETGDHGEPLLIDTHDAPVREIVWNLFRHAVSCTGPIPTLIEWDAAIPEFSLLQAEAQRAQAIMSAAETKDVRYAYAN